MKKSSPVDTTFMALGTIAQMRYIFLITALMKEMRLIMTIMMTLMNTIMMKTKKLYIHSF